MENTCSIDLMSYLYDELYHAFYDRMSDYLYVHSDTRKEVQMVYKLICNGVMFATFMMDNHYSIKGYNHEKYL